MFQVQFTQNGETQTLGYPTQSAAMAAAEQIFRSETVSTVMVLNAINPDDIIVVASWSRG